MDYREYETLKIVSDELSNRYRTMYNSEDLHVSVEENDPDQFGAHRRGDIFWDKERHCYDLYTDHNHNVIFNIAGDEDIDSEHLEKVIKEMMKEYE